MIVGSSRVPFVDCASNAWQKVFAEVRMVSGLLLCLSCFAPELPPPAATGA